MPRFALWGYDTLNAPKVAHLGGLAAPGVKMSELRSGLPLSSKWVSGSYTVKDTCDGLPDSIGKPPVVSRRLRDWVVAKNLTGVELLPVTIHDTKNKVMSSEYYLLHTTPMIDCVDLEASQATLNTIDKWSVTAAKGLVLREEQIPQGVSLFRAERVPSNVIVREALVDELCREGFSGLAFATLEQFDGFQSETFYLASEHGHSLKRAAKTSTPTVDVGAVAMKLVAPYLKKSLRSSERAASWFDHESGSLSVKFFERDELCAWLADAYADELDQLGCLEDGEWANDTVPLAAVAPPNTKAKTSKAFLSEAIGWVFFDGTFFVTTTDRWDRQTTFQSLGELIDS